MAIANGTAISNHGSSVSSLTLSNVVVGGSDRILDVVVALGTNTVSVSSVAFNTSESLTLLRFRQITGGVQRLEVWGLTAPTATTADVVITLSGSTNVTATAQPRTGVDQTTPREPDPLFRDGNSSGTTASDTIGTGVTWGGGDDVMAYWVSIKDDTVSWTTDAGVTEVTNRTANGASNNMRLVQLSDTDTEANKVFGTLGSATSWQVIGYNMNAAGGGGGSAIAAISNYYALRGLR